MAASEGWLAATPVHYKEDQMVTYDVAINTTDPVDALLVCARDGMPGIVVTELCESGTHSHALITADIFNDPEVRERIEEWFVKGIALYVQEVAY